MARTTKKTTSKAVSAAVAKAVARKPCILTIDIETKPANGWFWALFDQNIATNQVKDPGGPMTAAWKWLGESRIHFEAEWLHKDKFAWLRRVHRALSAADAVVTQNGDKFDLPKLNGWFLLAGMKPIPYVTSIDIRKTFKKLGFLSTRLDFVAQFLSIGRKLEHEGFPLWLKVMDGDEKARGKMERYNKHDVRLTERVYSRIRPYIVNHPHIHRHGTCPVCGHAHIVSHGWRHTRTMKYQRLQCIGCGHPFKGTGVRV